MRLLIRHVHLAAAIVIFVLAVSAARPAIADSYRVGIVGNGNGEDIYGIDSSGAVVIEVAFGICQAQGFGDGPCYQTYSRAGIPSGISAIPPSLAYDNGGGCSNTLPVGFFVLNASVCNNGREIFGGEYENPALAATLCATAVSGAEKEFCANNGLLIGLFTGLDPFADFISGLSGDILALNSNGDFAVVSGRTEYIYQAIDLTAVPEPGSLILVSTGSLLLSLLRRKVLI